MTAIELTGDDETKVEEFAGSLFMACLATMELANVELGVRLGLYEALAGAGPVTARDLASRAGIEGGRVYQVNKSKQTKTMNAYVTGIGPTNRIVMFDHDGRPIYYRNCKPTGLAWIDERPAPILVANDLAQGIAPGKSLVFAVVPYNYGDRIAMPLELYADKTGKKLIGFFGIGL